MSLRAKIVSYMIAIHLILGGVVVFVLIDRPWLLILFEALFTVSGLIGYMLVKSFFVPLNLIQTGAELMRERDFTTHFREVGQHEMDELIRIYNRMVDRLREERLKLEEQNLFLDKVLRASPTGVITLDHDGLVQQLNPGAELLLGLPSSEVVGKAPSDIEDPIFRSMSRLGPDDTTLVSPDGRKRIRCRRAEFFDRGFARAFFLIEELTEELRASEKAAYGKVIRMMSHEVNNSVGAVRSLLESCANYGGQLRAQDREDFEKAMEVASGRLHRLNDFMNSLATVARVPSPERRPCDVPQLLRDIVRLLGPELEKQRIVIDCELVELPPIALDKNQLEQALLNVFRNAIDSIDRGGRIVVRTGVEDQKPFASIRDDGTGLPDEIREQLFTPFFSTKRDGQGIGLTLVQEILSGHGFEFALRNHPEGGAEFRIRF